MLSLSLSNQTANTNFTASASGSVNSHVGAGVVDAEHAQKIEEHTLTEGGELRLNRLHGMS